MTTIRIAMILAGLALSCAGIAGAATDLRAQMPPAVFAKAGLDKLSAAELRVLERWLQGKRDVVSDGVQAGQVADPQASSPAPVPAPVAEAASAASFGEEHLAPRPQSRATKIRARIKGEFSGWSGKTLFRLDNGQVWRQRIGGRYRSKLEAPEVEVFKGRFGYYLKLVEGGRQVAVKRVK
ncbi:MAG: hypothetical protein AB8B93_01715 [Pseudomonadales bacterium]